MDWPVSVALAQTVQTLPVGANLHYEPKFDGHRVVLWRLKDTVRLQARPRPDGAANDVTANWTDLALAGMQLPAGVVLDGEAVIYINGKIDFGAAQSRAKSTPARARLLAEEHPATYAVFDVLHHPEHGDTRGWSYVRRRQLLEQLLEEYGIVPPIQAVPSTTNATLAARWYDTLQALGVEGLMIKAGSSTYKGGSRQWRKLRHAETVDAAIIGYTGSAARPRHLALRLPDGRTTLSQTLRAPLAAQVAPILTAAGSTRPARTTGGDPYSAVEADATVEVLAGTTRHAVATVTRLR
ncbi:hypothetical protein QR97_01840 [Streptomyces sp. PBH53]|uniref:ATP-dependent DNA ligase n=1 Tax=Streptomyces sp. PBH53 TaxID=1577075 RepID=UPI0006563F5F|nr:DNA ligase [Streptomyces sp. PBH53]AKN68712.1 hypothetical protein QR97_01840 [Streptomyces sp. PBH53]